MEGFRLRLNESASRKGLISDPQGKAKSVVFSEAGLKEAQRLLEKLFCESDEARAREPSEHVYAIVRFDS